MNIRKWLLWVGMMFLSISLQAKEAPAREIFCEGSYPGHLQGIDTDGKNIFWTFTTVLVKTDDAGKVLLKKDVPTHHGDLCVHDGVVYVAVNRGRFNQEQGAVSEVWSYRAKDLEFLKKYEVPQLVHGAGGMTWYDGSFYIVGGLPKTHTQNYVYQYTPNFSFAKRHDLLSGYTVLGIQTVSFLKGKFWFGIYGSKDNPAGVIRSDTDFATLERFREDGSVGMMDLHGRLYLAQTVRRKDKRWTGRAVSCKALE